MNKLNNEKPPNGDDDKEPKTPDKKEASAEISESRKLVTHKKKIHMKDVQCFNYAQSEEGASALAEPKDLSKSGAHDPNDRLIPVDRSRKRKRKNSFDEPFDAQNGTNNPRTHGLASDFMGSQGFRSASDMYNIAKKAESAHFQPSPATYRNKHGTGGAKPKLNKNSLLANQTSITSFMKASPVKAVDNTNQTNVDDNKNMDTNPTTESKPRRTVMYSPIKQIQGPIYISDSPSSSPSTSQGSSVASQPSALRDNAVVKQLFDAQKHLDSLPKNKKPSQLKSATKTKYIDRKHTLSKSESVASANEFENDSFDMNLVFGSDMDESMDSASQKKKDTKGDKYGLLGSGSYPSEPDKSGVNYFELLPPEVLENIFCQLPMLDLCLNSNRVCLAWNDIIANEKFVPWKKLYHKVKKDVGASRSDVQNLMRQNGMVGPSEFLIALIRYMRDFKPVTAGNMLQCLQKHSKYGWAKALIEERLQDCIQHEEPNPWSVVATLVIISHNVYDIQEIITCLSVPVSQCTSLEIIECLYCIATFLYAFKLAKNHDIWNGMHYRLFYALYLYENESTSNTGDLQMIMAESKKGQQSLMRYSDSSEAVKLTHEQMRIVKYKPKDDEVIKIVAFAGTGKTTTLVKYTQLRPDKKFLLVVYNKSVSDHAKTKFPPNVTCKTGHALAYGVTGRRYSAAQKLGNLSVYGLTQTLKNRKGHNLFVRAKFVLDTINHFLCSAEQFITTAHCPDVQIDEKTGRRTEITHADKMLFVEDAEDIWRQMKDYNNKKVNMSHDGYLKVFQLMRPSLREYDCILIDEAQDLTPAITDILVSQPQGKILVGDPHQQIYSFRGAVNAMEQVRADTIFYLTQSFRFGPEISHVAACCLEVLKKEKKKTLVGSGKKGFITGEKVGQLAIVSRLNVTVFNEAVKKCCYSDEDCKIAFVGGTDGFGFPMMLDMYALLLSKQEREKEGLVIKNKLIAKFTSFGDLENFATKTMDTELLGKIRIVKNYHHNLPVVLNKIKSKCVRDVRTADYVFSTAHKAKGLEFSTVKVTDDFLGESRFTIDLGPDMALNVQIPGILRAGESDENNLLYVAVTRAKNALQITNTVKNVLKQAGESFRYPVLSDDIKKGGKLFKCMETDAEFEPKKLTLQQLDVTLGDGRSLKGGLYSPQILTEDMDSFARLLGLTKDDIVKERKKQEQIDPHHFY